MPFTGDTYSLPNGSLVTDNLRSSASQHNTPLTDIADALTTLKTASTASDGAVTALEAREIVSGTGLTGGGDLSGSRTLALNSTSIASLALADTAVQPARSVTGTSGLTGGGDLSADRAISLDAASIASLARADSAVRSIVAGQSTSIDATDPQNPVVAFTGTGTGDMLAATYDPQNIADDAFKRVNHTGTQAIETIAGLTSALDDIDSALAGKQSADAQLSALAGLTGAAGSFVRWTGATAAAMQAILGPVAQSGGVPTGAIIERSSNANGQYVKFADGTLICIIYGITLAYASAAACQYAWTLPAAMNSTSYSAFAIRGSAGHSGSVTLQSVGAPFANISNSSSVIIGFSSITGSSWTSGGISDCIGVAIGRWI